MYFTFLNSLKVRAITEQLTAEFCDVVATEEVRERPYGGATVASHSHADWWRPLP